LYADRKGKGANLTRPIIGTAKSLLEDMPGRAGWRVTQAGLQSKIRSFMIDLTDYANCFLKGHLTWFFDVRQFKNHPDTRVDNLSMNRLTSENTATALVSS
jgi:hypothetical protein